MSICDKQKHNFYSIEVWRFIYIPLELNQAQLSPMIAQFKAVVLCATQKEIKGTSINMQCSKGTTKAMNLTRARRTWEKSLFLALSSHSAVATMLSKSKRGKAGLD